MLVCIFDFFWEVFEILFEKVDFLSSSRDFKNTNAELFIGFDLLFSNVNYS
jgi:hypothetical protein